MNIFKVFPALDNSRQLALWHKAQKSQWSAADLDWSKPVGVRAGHLRDQLGRLMTPLLIGEQSALYSVASLIPAMGKRLEVEGQFYLTTWAVDEARHTEIFAHFCRRIDREPLSIRRFPSGYLFQSAVFSTDVAEWLTGLLVTEVLAKLVMEHFVKVDIDPVLSETADRILDDEARHLGFNHLYMEDRFEALYHKGDAEGDALAEHLRRRLEMVHGHVSPMFEALAEELRSIELDGEEVLDVLAKDAMERLESSIRRGRRRAAGELAAAAGIGFSPVVAD